MSMSRNVYQVQCWYEDGWDPLAYSRDERVTTLLDLEDALGAFKDNNWYRRLRVVNVSTLNVVMERDFGEAWELERDPRRGAQRKRM